MNLPKVSAHMPAEADIKIDPQTRDRLRAAKVGGESYDDVIGRLLDEVGAPERPALEAG